MLVNNNNVSFTAKGILKFDESLKGDSKNLGDAKHPHRKALMEVVQQAFVSTKDTLKPLPGDEVVFKVKEDGVSIRMGEWGTSKCTLKNWSLWQFVSDPVQCLKDTAKQFNEMMPVKFKRRID